MSNFLPKTGTYKEMVTDTLKILIVLGLKHAQKLTKNASMLAKYSDKKRKTNFTKVRQTGKGGVKMGVVTFF